jgi:hypothetical protein
LDGKFNALFEAVNVTQVWIGTVLLCLEQRVKRQNLCRLAAKIEQGAFDSKSVWGLAVDFGDVWFKFVFSCTQR